ncbi:MAG: zinc ABC transporter substrate-binding protein [Lachnospiraceae bacterium]|nr:zinc ABC transporter substrate-binding protein [Lachnospiraceae bacterium]
MKKKLSLLFSIILIISTLVGCTGNEKEDDGSLKIVATIFPEYDWVVNIMGEEAKNADIELLLDNGADLHSYTLSFADMAKITDCDLFIYVGGESDEWVDDVLKNSENKDMVVINLIDVLGENAKTEELVEGMEAEEEGEEGEEGEEEYDEHVWLSLKNASIFCDEIANALVTLDPENKDVYLNNLASYKDELNALDTEYANAVSEADQNTILFADRFPFRYMTDDYNLNYYAAFSGCSSESEASFQTVIFLADKMDELNLNAIMTIEGTDKKMAETVRDNTTAKNQKILTLDSMQSISDDEIKAGKTYLSIMKDNLEVLKEALN